MTGRDIKTWQAARIDRALGPTMGYLHRLRERMCKRGFSPTDPLYQLVDRSFKDLQHLCMEFHYLSCKSGVGRLSKE